MTTNQKLQLLVDGSSYLFRAYHALPPLTNSKGQPTGAIYGVINMIKRLVEDTKPDYLAIVFDAKGKTFRNDLYDQYKANRPPMPDDLRQQIEPLHQVVQALGYPMLIISGVEADDVIGTLAQQGSNHGLRTLISTGDKDMAQLVTPDVTLINTMTNTTMDEQGVEKKFGVPPSGIIDYLALVGDTSDNIPGVPKVGPKTAVKWLSEYGSVENIIANADKFKGKIGENLRNSLDQLPLSKQLTTIKLDVDLETPPEQLIAQPQDKNALQELYKNLEFKSWLAQLNSDTEETSTPPQSGIDKSNYKTIFTQKELDEWLKRISSAPLFAFDLETTSLNYMEAEIVGCSFALDNGDAAYIPLAHDYPGAPDQLDRTDVLNQLKPLLEAETPAKVGQNLKYDKNVIANYDIEINGIAFDTMLESYVLDSTATRHDMDSLSLKYLNHETIHYEDIAGKGAKQITFNEIDIEQASPYAAEDADVTWQLHNTIWPQIQIEPKLKSVFQELEVPLIDVLSKVERTGVLVDADKLEQQSHEIAQRLLQLEQEAHDVAGQPFNLASPKQIQEILYDKLELPILAKTPKGQPSTAESVLQELALDYPLPRLILEHRSLAKLRSTYTDKLPKQINPKTGRVHTSYHQAVAATGRLSSSDPNLQNIPIRTEEGRRIRQAFIAPPGFKILAADYSQIELRIMAHLSNDEGLVNAFAQGEDIHRATAAEIFGLTLIEVSNEQRRSAKAINFGLIYGMSAFGLAKQLGINRSAAQEYVNLYFERYPGVLAFMDRMKAEAADKGYVETVFGRRLHLPDIKARNAQRRQYAERAAINAPMQGTAADIIKKAMIKVQRWIEQSSPEIKMIMQVHDELVFEVPAEQINQASQQIQLLMSDAAKLSVPLIVEAGVGDNWDEAH